MKGPTIGSTKYDEDAEYSPMEEERVHALLDDILVGHQQSTMQRPLFRRQVALIRLNNGHNTHLLFSGTLNLLVIASYIGLTALTIVILYIKISYNIILASNMILTINIDLLQNKCLGTINMFLLDISI